MNKKKLYIKLFWESPILTLFTLLFYAVFVTGILIAGSKFRFSSYAANMFKPFADDVIIAAYEENTPKQNQTLRSGLRRGGQIQNTGTIGTISGTVGYNSELEVVQYSEPIKRRLYYPLSSGRWIADKNEIVLTYSAAKHFSLNEKINFTSAKKSSDKGMSTKKKAEEKQYEFTVVGFLALDLLFSNQNTYSVTDKIASEHFISYAQHEGRLQMFGNHGPFYGIVEHTFEDDELNMQAVVFAIPSIGTTGAQLAESLQDKWGSYGRVEEFSPYAQRYENVSWQFWKQKESYLLLLYTGIILLLLVVWNCHVIIKKKQRYAIFYMSGASCKQIVRLLTMKFYLLVFLALCFGIYLIQYLIPCDNSSYMKLKNYQYCIALLLCFLLNFTVINITYFFVKRKNPFRERWER